MNTETRDQRRARYLKMRETMSAREIAAMEGISHQAVYQVLGPTTSTLTPHLLAVHAYICGYTADHKFPPSITEIAAAFPDGEGKPRSTSVVSYWLARMEKLNLIEKRERGSVRTLVTKRVPKKLIKTE